MEGENRELLLHIKIGIARQLYADGLITLEQFKAMEKNLLDTRRDVEQLWTDVQQ